MKRIVVALIAVLAVTGPAGAQDTVVATDGTVQLEAHRDGHRLCLHVVTTSPDQDEGSNCDRAPRSPFDARFTDRFSAKEPLGMAVPPAVASVEFQGPRKARDYPTSAAPGFTDRFVVVARAGRVQLVRFLDADGHLIGAAQEPTDHVVPGSKVVLRHSSGALASVQLQENLEPTPLRYDRVVRPVCLSTALHHTHSSSCAPGPGGRLLTDILPGCAPNRGLITGLAREPIERVRLLLGSGRMLTVPTAALPARFGHWRAYTVRPPRREAIRVVLGMRGGRVVARDPVAHEPTGLACRAEGDASINIGDELVKRPDRKHGSFQVAATVAGHRMLVADGGGLTLCGGLDGRQDCQIPPVDPAQTFLLRRGRVIGGFAAPSVARIDLHLDDGSITSAPTVPLQYSGRYSGTSRYLLVVLPGGRHVAKVVLRDASGTRLGTTIVLSRRRRRVLRTGRRAGVRFRIEREPSDIEPAPQRGSTCLRVAGTVAFPLCADSARVEPAFLDVGCRPRRALAFGILPRGTRAISLGLAGGGRLSTATIHVGSAHAWIARIPLRDQVRTLRYRGHLPKLGPSGPRLRAVQPFTVLPAARQCGYLTLRFPSVIASPGRAARAILSRR